MRSENLPDPLKQRRVSALHPWNGLRSPTNETHETSPLLVCTIAIVIAFSVSSFPSKRAASFPPRAPSVLPWLRTALSYISSSNEFPARCQVVGYYCSSFIILMLSLLCRTKLTKQLAAIFITLRVAESDLQLEDQCGRVTVPKGKRGGTHGRPTVVVLGRNLCRGRYLAVYEMKVVAILYLYLFDFAPVAKGSSP
ncbi:hypothetical protein EDC04DRAFT_918582 [Pisolithus marmoratus]|nr:hypothetical protein EDC04DRAFT_918582 [Pisolithus marmoratus]